MITIEYSARRNLKGGVNNGDIITIEIPVDSFTPQVVVKNSVSTSLSGNPQISLKHFYREWPIKTVFDSINSFADYEQFLYSIIGGAPFTITDYDHSDAVVNVLVERSFSMIPIRRFNAGEFNYSFTVREI